MSETPYDNVVRCAENIRRATSPFPTAEEAAESLRRAGEALVTPAELLGTGSVEIFKR